MDNFLLFYLGLLFSLGVFALKVALVLPLLKGYKAHILIIILYSLLFYLFYEISLRFEGLILPLLERGVYLHLFTASGLIIWGAYLLFRPSCSHRALLFYLMPCPVCLLSISLSVIYFQKFERFYALPFLILPLSFLVLTYSLYLIFRVPFKGLLIREKEGFRWLGLVMLFSSLYLLGSFYFPQRFNELFFLKANANSMNLIFPDQRETLAVFSILFLISLLAGFFQFKIRRKL
jgi:predicted transporter